MNRKRLIHSRSNSPSVDGTDGPIFTPESSATPSFSTPMLFPGPSPDDPIPSIEPPTPGLNSYSDEKIFNGFEDLSLDRQSSEFGNFQRGPSNGLQPFTFRALHNTTPEPTAQARQIPALNLSSKYRSRRGKGLSQNKYTGISGVPSLLPASANTGMPQSTKIRASSAPVVPPPPDTVPKPTRYDIKNEIPPKKPYFDKDFQKALVAGKSVAQKLGEMLGSCELAKDPKSQVYSLVQTANELSKFDAPSLCKIAIVGDSGVGKSSLINSLLDIPSIAMTGGIGAACTSVVTEYLLRKPEQTATYSIEIERMTNKEIEEQLRELLWSYRNFHLWDLEKEGSDLRTLEAQQQLEKKAKIAWDTLNSAFGSSKELTEKYLQDKSDGAEERIHKQLKLWTDSLVWPADTDQNKWQGTAESVEEYEETVGQFLAGNLWPFIRVIRVFLSSQVLKSGAILADLPGFHDSNNARIKAAEDYLYHCDEIFVVADIIRVGTNQNVESVVEKTLARNLKDGKPSQGISLVCAKSELQELQFEEMKKRFFPDGSQEAARIESLEQVIEDAEKDDTKPGALRDRNNAHAELHQICLTARNAHVEGLILEKHAKMLKPRILSVFFVSNSEYLKHAKRPKAHDLSIKGSGIPQLRQHCHKIPSRVQFRVGHHFLTISLKSLVQQVQLWLAGGSLEAMPNNATIRKILDTLQGNLKTDILKAINTVGETQKANALDIMIRPMEINLGVWTGIALEISNTWVKYHSSQVACFCANYGSWGSTKATYSEWNLELIAQMVDFMSRSWDSYALKSVEIIEQFKIRIFDLLDGLISQVKDFKGAHVFAESLITKKDSIKYTLVELKERVGSIIDEFRHDATKNHHSAYVFQEMSPAYRECMKDSVRKNGDGVTQRRLDRLQKAIGTTLRPILFPGIKARLKNDLLLVGTDLVKILEEEVKEILAQVGTNLELLQGTEAQVLAKNGDFLERLGKVVTEVLKEMEEIGDNAAQAKKEAKDDGYY